MDLNQGWMNEIIYLTPNHPIRAGVLFIGGMKKEHLRDMLNNATEENAQMILAFREEAGKELTELNISPREATNLLINIGETAYQKGNRTPWAIYAHGLLSSSVGCIPMMAVFAVLVITPIIWFF